MKSHLELRKAFVDFWEAHGHKLATPAPLVLTNDPTTLFNSSGMQQLIPNLQGEPHPQGVKLFNIQPCFRAVDIEEVGDNRHTTFFEMMGNWSLGDYFKKEQLPWFWEFLTVNLKLPKEKLYVSIFEGDKNVPKDEESHQIWQSLGIPEDHIFFYGVEKNWWSRSGTPEKMPPGEIGGPDSEVFYEFTQVEHDPKYGEKCHPNCDCGRFLEIGNSVFIQYRKKEDGTLEELPQKNVDFGGGLERILAAMEDDPDVFKTDIFSPIIEHIESLSQDAYSKHSPQMRIVADHLKAATFMIAQGTVPSNKEHGYIVRRLIRRAVTKMHQAKFADSSTDLAKQISESVLDMYADVYFDGVNKKSITTVIGDEVAKFLKTLHHGVREIEKIDQGKIDGKVAFDLYQNYGLPIELTEELLKEKGLMIDREQFRKEFEKHKELSRTASAGKFKGGLADHSEQVVKYHTATHLIHQALFDVFGNDIRQEGSNITGERLRFDFSTSAHPTKEDMKKVQEIVQKKVDADLPMTYKMMPREEAFKVGARSFFKEKYPEQVKVYYIGHDLESAYSKEFCGGPHVKNTSTVGHIEIYKFEKIGSNLYRLYAR